MWCSKNFKKIPPTVELVAGTFVVLQPQNRTKLCFLHQRGFCKWHFGIKASNVVGSEFRCACCMILMALFPRSLDSGDVPALDPHGVVADIN